MIELHYTPGGASFVPHVLLRELGLPFELRQVDRAANAHKQPAYLKLNPNGLIPVLVHGELVLYETAAIALYLADAHPAACLMPELGSPQRAHAYKWLMWCTNTLQATLLHYFYPERLVDEGNLEGARQVQAQAKARVVGSLLPQIEAHLASHGQAWFSGEQYSLLDAYVFMLCRWTRGFDSGAARELPHTAPYLQRVLERPAVQQVFAAEALSAPAF